MFSNLNPSMIVTYQKTQVGSKLHIENGTEEVGV